MLCSVRPLTIHFKENIDQYVRDNRTFGIHETSSEMSSSHGKIRRKSDLKPIPNCFILG